MFGLMTKAEHERQMAAQINITFDRCAEIAALRAEIDHLRPLAQKHLNSLAALKQNQTRRQTKTVLK